MKKKIATVLSFSLFVASSCVTSSKYYRLTDDFRPEEIPKEAHYIYRDHDITIAARIRNSISYESYVYECLICNIGNEPIQLNLSFVNIFVIDDGEKYLCKKPSSAKFYTQILDPNAYRRAGFVLDSRFKHKINDIDELYFRFSSNKTYTLTKNQDAKWE